MIYASLLSAVISRTSDRIPAILAKCPPEKSDLEKMGAVRYPDVSPGGADEKAPEAVMRDMDRQLRELGYK